MTDAGLRSEFMPFHPDSGSGRLVASFGLNEVGDGTADTSGLASQDALPDVNTGPADSPLQNNDPAAVYSGTGYEINSCFNRTWDDAANADLKPNLQRFIDLRVTPQDDTTPSPLNPDPAVGFTRCRIVAGSEEIIGPDQKAGPNFGAAIRYERTTHDPGPNQYKINYVDQAEPDYALAFPGHGVPPAVYTPTDFMSAVIQPRYKVGYVQLNSDPNVPLPAGSFHIFYRFQFTHPNDSFSVDYDSRQVMSILLTIRTYPQSNLPLPQNVTVSTSAEVRNFIR
jgi:hypothetical protein